jgi:SAM-dependent methyltransferase
MHSTRKQPAQIPLFEDEEGTIDCLDSALWNGSFNGKESTLHQLSPYVGKLKSGMVRILLRLFSNKHETVFDPFSGSGVVPLEAVLLGRVALANDLSPYAYALTRGKLGVPTSEYQATQNALALIEAVEADAPIIDLSPIPAWVREFFHPDTLREILAAFRILRQQEDYFLLACLLGILHHVRPGFLSYPASHLVPYLRKTRYPPDEFPEMYTYRDLRSRLLAKVKRAYHRSLLPLHWEQRQYRVWQTNAMQVPVESETVDCIISSPPYFGALDYARDNRLRLWFLGCEDWKELDSALTASNKVYLSQMGVCLQEMYRVLKPGGSCVLVLGDVRTEAKTQNTAEILSQLASEVTQRRLVTDTIYHDVIPDERRSRRKTRTTTCERIVVMHKE